jgi:hypothetical protein
MQFSLNKTACSRQCSHSQTIFNIPLFGDRAGLWNRHSTIGYIVYTIEHTMLNGNASLVEIVTIV